MATIIIADTPGMSLSPSTTATSMTAASTTNNLAMGTTTASPTMNGQAMASQTMDSPSAGMYDMATMRNMCSLPGMQDMCNDNARLLIGVCTALLVLATSAVILRLISRRISALPFWWDDVAITLSLLVSYGCSALAFVDARAGVGRHFETVSENHVVLLFKTTVAYEILYSICITLVKISILLFYYRLFAVRKGFQRTIFVALALVTCWCLVIVLLNILQCIPVKAAWIRPFPHSKCINNNASLLGTAITNVIIDLAILILPIEPIWRLNLTIRRKLALTAIFCLGAFICAAAVARVWAIQNINQTDVTWSYVRPLTWSGVEISIGITCACLPILQPLLLAVFGPYFGRTPRNSNSAAGNRSGNFVEEISGVAHARTQMVRRDTCGSDEMGQMAQYNNKPWKAPYTWLTEAEGGAGNWSDDGIPLKRIHVTEEVEVGGSSAT